MATSTSSKSSTSTSSNKTTSSSNASSNPVSASSAAAGITGYTSGGGAIYGSSSPAVQSGKVLAGGGGSSNVAAYNDQGYPVDAAGKVVTPTTPFGGNSAAYAQSKTQSAPAPSNPAEKSIYDIKQGDTLSGISTSTGVKLAELLRANPNIKDPNMIAAGEKLNIPGQIPQDKTDYRAGFEASKLGGAQAPQDQAAGMNQASQMMPTTPTVNPVAASLSESPEMQKYQQDYANFQNSVNQRESLVSEYERMRSSSGLDGINTQLLNVQKIMRGSEDDIRTEITKAGGFATESQVMAMTNARNKQNIVNYQNLVDTKQQIEEHINTVMGLSKQDRADFVEQWKTQMDYDTKQIEFRDKAISDSRSALDRVVSQVGYEGLYAATKGVPTNIRLTEQTLGLAPGGLQKLATMPPSKEDQLNLQLKQLQVQNAQSNLQTDAMQRSNIQSQINERNQSMSPTVGVPDKVLSKIQSSNEYKTINSVLPAIQAIKGYRDAVSKYGTAEILNAKGKGEKQATYGNAIAAWKSLAGLGALSGADFGLAENVIPAGGKALARTSVQTQQLDSAMGNAVKQTENLTKRLSQLYPEAAPLLEKQLDDVYVTAYPDKYKVGSDGQVYEITK